MKKSATAFLFALLVLGVCGSAQALDRAAYDQLVTVFDSAKVQEADIFAPVSYEKASRALTEATDAIEKNKRQSTLDKSVDEAREHIENALKAAQLAKVSLQEYLPPRDKARAAKAPTLVPELYQEAEEQFLKATRKVEDGNVKDGLKEAVKSGPFFDVAELEAIRTDVLGSAVSLIDKATVDEAPKYALATLNKARGALEKGNSIINADRYNRAAAEEQARRAEFEARHASNIAQSVRSLERNDQAWEKLMLVYEIQMNRVGESLDLNILPFDEGAIAAADTLIGRIQTMEKEKEGLASENLQLASGASTKLKETLIRLGQEPLSEDPIALASQVNTAVAELLSEKETLAGQLQSQQTELAQLSEEHKEVAAELDVRLERERLFREAKTLLNPSEGEVLFNAANDIVLRLSGLSFDVGKSDLTPEHQPLLDKVKKAVGMFPDAQLVVEGHTDATGDAKANLSLSEKRAYAVMQYLRESMLIPADRIKAIGFGSEKPVASNTTPDGRAKNRRIDIIIMQ